MAIIKQMLYQLLWTETKSNKAYMTYAKYAVFFSRVAAIFNNRPLSVCNIAKLPFNTAKDATKQEDLKVGDICFLHYESNFKPLFRLCIISETIRTGGDSRVSMNNCTSEVANKKHYHKM